jgi:hypothetical protein
MSNRECSIDRGCKRLGGALLILVVVILLMMAVTGGVNAKTKASKCTTLYALTFPSQNA